MKWPKTDNSDHFFDEITQMSYIFAISLSSRFEWCITCVVSATGWSSTKFQCKFPFALWRHQVAKIKNPRPKSRFYLGSEPLFVGPRASILDNRHLRMNMLTSDGQFTEKKNKASFPSGRKLSKIFEIFFSKS